MSTEKSETRRRSARLHGYDFSQPGAYFVTICTRKKAQFFRDQKVSMIVEDCWKDIPNHFPTVEIDEFVVMPNHFHGIIVITNDQSRGVRLNAPTSLSLKGGAEEKSSERNRFSHISPKKGSLGVIIRTFRGEVTRRIRSEGFQEFGWQQGYYDRIIRNRDELNNIRRYISENPLKWELDKYYPSR